MSTDIQLFDFHGTSVRVIERAGEPWFVAKDVAELLGYTNPQKAVRDHCKGVNETFLPSSGGPQMTSVIPERDVYRLIMRSKLPAAEAFEEWVVGTVLPSVRKHGGYIAGQENATDPAVIMANAVLVAQSVIAAQAAKLAVAEPKAILVDQHYAHHDFMPLTKFARSLDGVASPSIKKDLLRHGYLWKPSKDAYRARSQYRDKLFREKFNEFSGKMDLFLTPDGCAAVSSLHRGGQLTMKKGYR